MALNYHFIGEETIASPALIYYKNPILKNIDRAVTSCGSAERLWPHVKSHKSLDLTKIMVKKGITKFKCATVAEAEMAAMAGAEKVILAYPLVGPAVLRFLSLLSAYPKTRFYAIADDAGQLRALSEAAERLSSNGELPSNGRVTSNGRVPSVLYLLDINTGMDRTGVRFDAAPSLYNEVKALPHLTLAGLHCYDGDRHERNYEERLGKTNETLAKASDLMHRLEHQGAEKLFVVMGGSPSFPCYCALSKEVYYSPGTIFTYDAGYLSQFPDLKYDPAVTILTRVVSHPTDHSFTLDCGSKAISTDQSVRGLLWDFPNAEPLFQSEEHWTFRMKPGHESELPAIETVLYILPWHVCPTNSLYDVCSVVENGTLVGEWPITARGRRIRL